MTTPDKGFYYHHKHDPMKGETDHAYEVLGTAWHTEDGSYTVIYRPLYENDFLQHADFCARPLEMFMENVEKDGKTFPRFSRITDPALLSKLTHVRDTMYP
jgi:hypothetical protein